MPEKVMAELEAALDKLEEDLKSQKKEKKDRSGWGVWGGGGVGGPGVGWVGGEWEWGVGEIHGFS